MTENDLQPKLEALVDTFELRGVLTMLSDICRQKSVHVRENWQDEEVAMWWEDAEKQIDKTITKVFTHP